VPAATPEMQGGNPLRIWAEEYDTLPLNKQTVKAKMPDIYHMKLIEPFDNYLKRKLFIHNMAHATVAYLGSYDEKQFFADAWVNPAIKLITHYSMTESAMAFSAETNVSCQALFNFTDNIAYRFSNKKLIMPLERICSDPIRKLSENERLTGPVILCEKHGLCPVYLGIGIAAAMMYRNSNDVSAPQLQQQIEKNGVSSVINALCNNKLSDRFINVIESFYKMFKQKASLVHIIEKAEQLKNKGLVVN
jgi:mannitol-1-phosphate 5-dehydrogenase